MEHILERILEELYLGNVVPCDYTQPDNPKYDEFVKNSVALEAELLARLNGEEKEIYKQLWENFDMACTMEKMQSFINGYTIASRLALTVLSEEENPAKLKIRGKSGRFFYQLNKKRRAYRKYV